MKHALYFGCLALVASSGIEHSADAKRRYSYSTKSSKRDIGSRELKSYGSRAASSNGECPCNGGDVCIGPRGGRYCITNGGNKRYGV